MTILHCEVNRGCQRARPAPIPEKLTFTRTRPGDFRLAIFVPADLTDGPPSIIRAGRR